VQEGKILSWGVSNFAVDDLEEAWSLAGERGLTSNQVLYHLEDRGIEHDILPWCEAHNVVVTGYSPFGHGRFPSSASPGGRVLAQIAAAHGATPRQVAMRFLVRRPLLITIPKASTLPHTEDNAGAGELQLSAAEIAEIDAAFPLGPRPRVAPRLFSPGY
jgi:diketogulonate reductase-like aldo/keto reductase